jgi:predicted DCC family thiol-disulfide oxidoreductase YuxK
MERLFVLYDDRCGICRWARRWVEVQPTFLEVVFLAANSQAARDTFPTLPATDPPEELVAVSDAGEVYRGGSAWVMVLFALREYREWSLRLGSPALLPVARQAFSWFSRRRGRFSQWLGLDDEDLAATFGRVETLACEPNFSASTSSDNENNGRRGAVHAPGGRAVPQRGTNPGDWRRQFKL